MNPRLLSNNPDGTLINTDRSLLLFYLGFIVFVAFIITPLALYFGYINLMKYTLCTLFTGGASLSVLGYKRYIPPGPRISFFLVLLLGKSLSFALLGLGFFLSALLTPPPDITPTLLVVYITFAVAGANKFFAGLYVFIGAGRGWLDREVYKTPWSRETERKTTRRERQDDLTNDKK